MNSEQNISLPSNKVFGYFFSGLFLVISGYTYYKSLVSVAILMLVVAFILFAISLICPRVLDGLNRLWYGLGLVLGKITSPIVLGIIYFALITPIASVTRLFGRDELLLKKKNNKSYWLARQKTDEKFNSFERQF